MDRRDFLKISAVSLGVIVSQPLISKASAAKKLTSHIDYVPDGYVKEPSRNVPIMASADVVVVGGGPAGFAAALSAAREGASVILVERNWYLGGLWTGGLVLPVLALYGRNGDKHADKAIGGICDDVCGRLAEIGMVRVGNLPGSCPVADPEGAKYILAEMLHGAGVRVLYNCTVTAIHKSGDRIDTLILETKSGRMAIRCKAVVDCSGDGDIIEFAGEDFSIMKYHVGAMARMGGTDKIDPSAPGFEEIRLGDQTPIEGVRLMHRRGKDYNGLDAFAMSQVQYEIRKDLFESVEAMKKKPGYDKVYLLESPPMLGIRVTRVLDSRHHLTVDESMNYTEFDDCIGMAGFCDPFEYNGKRVSLSTRPIWQIPYRSLLPKKTPNLIVAGRCFDFDKVLAFDAREIGTCFVTGQAAGTAAALGVNTRTALPDLDPARLQSTLRTHGARLDF